MASGLGRLGGLGGRRVPAAWERLRGLADDAPALIVAGLVVTALAVGVLAGINPKLAIAAALALGFAGAVIANVTVGLCLFAVISFLDVLSRIGSSTFGFTKIVGLLLVVSWLATISTRKDGGRDFLSAHPLMTYVLALFVAWSTLSFVWAEVPGEALQ